MSCGGDDCIVSWIDMAIYRIRLSVLVFVKVYLERSVC